MSSQKPVARAVPGVVIDVPEPAVADGKPSLPAYHARVSTSGVARGKAVPNPNPVWDPEKDGWATPPPESGVGDYRWTVGSLPDPSANRPGFSGNWYWLGEPSSHDGTLGLPAEAQQWKADPSTGGPTWHSFFPFKPSVSAVNAHIPGGPAVHHLRCVHMNSTYAEHMWIDLGTSAGQPFTWVIVAMPTSTSYIDHILDSGRNPDDVGFPRISAASVARDRRISDGLSYRTGLTSGGGVAKMFTDGSDQPLGVALTGGVHPRMYVAGYDGAHSFIGMFDPRAQRLIKGKVSKGPSYLHRYTVLGRQQGWISQRRASNLMVFEMRYWHHLLNAPDLTAQYAQLSSTYQFDRY